MKIKIDEKIIINGSQQFISIRGEKPGLPLLLYLHGGPGDAALPLVLKYNIRIGEAFYTCHMGAARSRKILL